MKIGAKNRLMAEASDYERQGNGAHTVFEPYAAIL